MRAGDELVHARPFVRHLEVVLDLLAQVVGRQHSVARRLCEAVPAHRDDIGVGPDQHPEVPVEAPHAPDRLRALEVKLQVTVGALHGRGGKERHQVRLHSDRSGPGATAAVWRGEGLVQVHVHRVETHVTRPADAHECVQVGSVVVEHRSGGVDHLGYIQYLSLEQPQGIGVRQHQRGDLWRKLRLQVGEADPAVRTRLHLHHVETTEGRARGVGAVRRIGDEDLCAGVAARVVIRLDHPERRPFAVRTRGRLQGHPLHPDDRAKRLLEPPHQLERALDAVLVLVRMEAGEPGQDRHRLVHDRVVFHGAAAEGVELLADRVVHRSQAAVVAHDLGLAESGKRRRVGAKHLRGQHLGQL